MTGAPVMKRFPQTCQLVVLDDDEVYGEPFKSLAPSSARSTLGCYKAQIGQQKRSTSEQRSSHY
jgi:hypothetical protein